MPDGILVKPAKLDYWEYAQMKTHSAEGARIVEEFGGCARRCRSSGTTTSAGTARLPGQPRGDAIPLEAAIVGLADAWNTMTTDRPYHRALTENEALARFAPAAARSSRRSSWTPSSSPRRFLPDELGLDEPLQRAV